MLVQRPYRRTVGFMARDKQGCQETCQARQNVRCQGCRAGCSTLQPINSSLVSVKACHGNVAVCQGVISVVLSPEILGDRRQCDTWYSVFTTTAAALPYRMMYLVNCCICCRLTDYTAIRKSWCTVYTTQAASVVCF